MSVDQLVMNAEGDAVVTGEPPTDEPVGALQLVTTFEGPMPTGVTVSHSGRIFVNYPKWGDDVPATVTELRGGHAVAYPDERWNSRRLMTTPRP